MRRLLRWAAAGTALPAFFLLLLALGWSSTSAAALTAALALLPAAQGRAPVWPQALLAACAGALFSTLVLLPAAGIGGAAAAAAALACCGLVPRLGEAPEQPERGLPADAAAAAFCGLALWRCGAFLFGHSLYAAVIAACGAGVGLAAGRAARPRAAALRQALPGLGPVAAGLAGLLALHWLRITELNDTQAARIRQPLLGWADAWAYAAQLFAAFAAWTAAYGLLEERQEPSARAAAGARAVPLAPWAAAVLLGPLGPDGAAAAGFLLLCAVGAARGVRRWRQSPILSRAMPAAFVAAAALAWTARSFLRDATLGRLEAVYPGGHLLSWSESGGRTLGVYRFATGLPVLLRDGVSDDSGGDAAREEVYVPLLSHPTKRVLLVGAIHPEAAAAAADLGAAAEFYDRGACAPALRALGGGLPASVTSACGGWRVPRGPWDAVVVQVNPPLASPESALALTREAAGAWKKRLSEDGVLAWRVPAPLSSAATQSALAALQSQFPSTAYVALSEDQTLLLASRFLSPEPVVADWRSVAGITGIPSLSQQLSQGSPATAVDRPAARPPDSAARPLLALPARLRL